MVSVSIILMSLLVMLCVARATKRSEKVFDHALKIFLLMVSCCMIVIFLAVLRTVRIQYGNDFRRKIFIVKDAKT